MIDQDDILQARILLVDDDVAERQSLSDLLARHGYLSVSSTADAPAVSLLHAATPFDLIVLDLDMPGFDGFAVMAALQAHAPDTWLPVLAMTGDASLKLRAVDAGARDFIDKPFNDVEVLTRIRNLLEVRLLHREARDYGAHMEQTVRDRTAELERFRGAMDATADAIFLIDPGSMAIVDVSEGACRMLGYRREALLRIDPVKLGLARDGQLQHHAKPRKHPREHDVEESELLCVNGKGTVPVETSWQLQGQGVEAGSAAARC